MAEGFEPYHVPQQSRRDKLRIVAQNHPSVVCVESSSSAPAPAAGLLPLYDASSLLSSSDLLTAHEFQHQQQQDNKATNPVCVVKEEGVNLMGFVGGASTSSHHNHHPYLDPHSTLHNLNPSSILDINNNNNPFLFTAPHNLQNQLRDFDQSYNGGEGSSEVVLFKPEPLALSLSSHHTTQNNSLPLELNLQRYGSAIYGDHRVTSTGYVVPSSSTVAAGAAGSTSNEVSRSTSSLPFGPFTGYASILKGSRFLKPAQQLLEEFCDVGQGVFAEKNYTVDSSLMDPPLVNLNASGIVVDDGDGSDNRRKKSRLISMLDEVYRRYKQYYQQMQAAVASFEYVAGLGNAAPFANLALKAMSKHFRSLKNAITDQLQFTNKAQIQANRGKDEASTFGSTDRGPYGHRPVLNSGFIERQSQPVWRPQRGLPERAVTVLRAWLFEHFLHPYPTDTEKLMLAKQTGLSRSQVSNWFINARVRLWKPMVEEIHMLETRQGQKATQREEQSANRSSDHLPSSNSLPSENPSTSTQRMQETPSKRSRDEFPDIPVGNEEPPNLSYNSLSNHPHVGVGVSMAGGNSGVSLTLGLYQNNGIGLSEPYPISAAQRFGLVHETSSEGFVLSGYEAQSRIFGRDVIGGQLLHDFVG